MKRPTAEVMIALVESHRTLVRSSNPKAALEHFANDVIDAVTDVNKKAIKDMDFKLKSLGDAHRDWYSKSSWILDKADNLPFDSLGMHMADVIFKYVTHLENQVAALQQEVKDNANKGKS